MTLKLCIYEHDYISNTTVWFLLRPHPLKVRYKQSKIEGGLAHISVTTTSNGTKQHPWCRAVCELPNLRNPAQTSLNYCNPSCLNLPIEMQKPWSKWSRNLDNLINGQNSQGYVNWILINTICIFLRRWGRVRGRSSPIIFLVPFF